jgi:2'-5' RNA ligase
MPSKNLTRTFISIEPPLEITKEIARIQQIISKQKFTGKLTEPSNLHLTLKFLGHLPNEKLKKVKSLLSKIIFPEFTATLQKTGTFNFKGQPRIVWIKVSSPELFDLQKTIDQTLSQIFPQEKRFMSHLTIARIKHTKNPKEFIKYIENLGLKKLHFQVNSIKLKSSELKFSHPIYKTLKTYKLHKTNN